MNPPGNGEGTACRDLYLYSLDDIASRPAFGAAVSLLAAWSAEAKGRNAAAAACHYLAHNVVPALQGGGAPPGPVPGWVAEALFLPEPEPAPPPLAFHGDRETFHEIVLMTYGELNEVRTMSDASFMEKTLLGRYRASGGPMAMLWHGAMERLRNVVARRIAGEPPLPAPYWDAAMRMNMPRVDGRATPR